MSAYALPGLFPPIASAVGAATTTTAESEGSSSTAYDEDSTRTSPLHEADRSISGILKASVDRLCTPLLYSSAADNSKNKIQVKEAKIDPVRLVQCVTQTPKSPTQATKRRNSIERLCDSPQQKSPNTMKKKKKKTVELGTPHDEAIQFELSISFNGRKYTATRTLQCIIQLRDDLISEMNNRKRWLQIRRPGECDPPESRFSSEDIITVQIPEIPPMTGDDSGSSSSCGFVGKGFTMFHAMVTSYVPAMERWLRSVMAVVPQDSECLMNFLWEPLPEIPVDFASKSCASIATLGSIKELDYNTEDSDSDDEWEG